MMDDAQTQDEVRRILEALHIRKVICVDDEYEATRFPSVERAIALAQTAIADGQALSLGQLAGSNEPVVPSEILSTRIRQLWESMAVEQRAAMLASLERLAEHEEEPDDDLSALHRFVPTDILYKLTPDQWRQRWHDLLDDVSADNAVLCLFDMDLAGTGSPEGGLLLIQHTLEAYAEQPVVCAGLTHLATINEETDKCRAWAGQGNLSRQQLMVLSKQRLHSGDLFIDGLKLGALNGARDMLAREVHNIHQKACERAKARLEAISLEAFDEMVIQRSLREGIWEAETLFRLFGIAQRLSFEEQAFSAEERARLDAAIAWIRSLGSVTHRDAIADWKNECSELQREEYYQEGSFVNSALLPVQLGDVFRLGETRYVLLGQPCDLQLRKKGHRRTEQGSLCRILAVERRANRQHLVCHLEHFGDGDESCSVDLARYWQISFDVLDLASFNRDGRCEFHVGQRSLALHESSAKRYKLLNQKYATEIPVAKNLMALAASCDAPARQCLERALARHFTASTLDIELRAGESCISFGIRRVGRLRPLRAQEVLNRYASVIARPAADMPLA